MGERSSDKWNSKRVMVLPPVPVEKTVRIVLLRNANFVIYGSVSGRKYFFPGAGSSVDVLEEDAQGLLEMRRNSCNCSGMPGLPYFELGG